MILALDGHYLYTNGCLGKSFRDPLPFLLVHVQNDGHSFVEKRTSLAICASWSLATHGPLRGGASPVVH
jgi:hypothetical protein